MRGYLIFSLNKAIEVSNKISEYQLNKNLIFLTDRVIIYSLLRKKNLKVILIQKFLAGESNVLRAVAPSVDASSDPLFSQFVGGLSLDTTLHGEKTGLIKQGVMLL